jgi:hypothetical protein
LAKVCLSRLEGRRWNLVGFAYSASMCFADGVIAVRHKLVKRTLLFHTIREGAEELATRPTRVSRLTQFVEA